LVLVRVPEQGSALVLVLVLVLVPKAAQEEGPLAESEEQEEGRGKEAGRCSRLLLYVRS
jgi:hypothetical protein